MRIMTRRKFKKGERVRFDILNHLDRVYAKRSGWITGKKAILGGMKHWEIKPTKKKGWASGNFYVRPKYIHPLKKRKR